MTQSEFISWFKGFAEGIGGTPNAEQWKRIQDEVAKLGTSAKPLNTPTPRSIFDELYGKKKEEDLKKKEEDYRFEPPRPIFYPPYRPVADPWSAGDITLLPWETPRKTPSEGTGMLIGVERVKPKYSL